MSSGFLNRMSQASRESFDQRSPISIRNEAILPFSDALARTGHPDVRMLVDYAEIQFSCTAYAFEGGPSLSCEEARAVYVYTCEAADSETSLYSDMNERLRDRDRARIVPYLSYIKLLHSALSKMLRSIDRNLWRAVKVDLYSYFKDRIGQTIVFWGVTSCTTDMNVVKQFLPEGSGGTLFCIKTPLSSCVAKFSAYQAEAEHVLAAATALKVDCDCS
jgi:hypothetical protein